jgi:hypothetical protein
LGDTYRTDWGQFIAQSEVRNDRFQSGVRSLESGGTARRRGQIAGRVNGVFGAKRGARIWYWGWRKTSNELKDQEEALSADYADLRRFKKQIGRSNDGLRRLKMNPSTPLVTALRVALDAREEFTTKDTKGAKGRRNTGEAERWRYNIVITG